MALFSGQPVWKYRVTIERVGSSTCAGRYVSIRFGLTGRCATAAAAASSTHSSRLVLQSVEVRGNKRRCPLCRDVSLGRA